MNQTNNIIIIGAGNLGQALANYQDFEKRGFSIKAIFDVNPRLIGLTVRGVEIMDIEKIGEFVKNNDVRIAALTLPKQKAQKAAQELVNLGIKAFWNFASVDLHLPEDIVVENVHLSESLMTLSYRINSMNQ